MPRYVEKGKDISRYAQICEISANTLRYKQVYPCTSRCAFWDSHGRSKSTNTSGRIITTQANIGKVSRRWSKKNPKIIWKMIQNRSNWPPGLNQDPLKFGSKSWAICWTHVWFKKMSNRKNIEKSIGKPIDQISETDTNQFPKWNRKWCRNF